MQKTTGRSGQVALVERMAQGDAAALAAFYDATSAHVYRLALVMTGAEGPASELCREAYLRAWREAGLFDPERVSALAWMLGLTHQVGAELTAAA